MELDTLTARAAEDDRSPMDSLSEHWHRRRVTSGAYGVRCWPNYEDGDTSQSLMFRCPDAGQAVILASVLEGIQVSAGDDRRGRPYGITHPFTCHVRPDWHEDAVVEWLVRVDCMDWDRTPALSVYGWRLFVDAWAKHSGEELAPEPDAEQ